MRKYDELFAKAAFVADLDIDLDRHKVARHGTSWNLRNRILDYKHDWNYKS